MTIFKKFVAGLMAAEREIPEAILKIVDTPELCRRTKLPT